MPPKIARCPYCSKALPSQNAVRLHVSATLSCNETWKQQFSQRYAKPAPQIPFKTQGDVSSSSLSWSLSDSLTDDEMEAIADNFNPPSPPPPPPKAISEEDTRLSSCPENIEENVRGLRFSEPYPRSIAIPIGVQKTRFEKQREEEKKIGKLPWEPFSSQDEWELARWLINHVNQKGTDTYLKLLIVTY
jgi:hypothetical protein